MPLFEGLSKDEKATAVLAALSVDGEVTIHELTARSGLTKAQAHQGIRHLREARNCVVTNRRGPDSTYKLAEDAPEVRDYAVKRMAHWQTQIQIMQNEMELAQALLPGAESIKVRKAAAVLTSLLEVMALDEVERKEMDKRERAVTKRENKLLARR